MITLQRSDVSFRRQGSSGLIWDDRLKVLQRKPGVLYNTEKGEQKHTQDLKRKEIDSSSAASRSRRENKPQGCSFSALFGRCSGSRTSYQNVSVIFLTIFMCINSIYTFSLTDFIFMGFVMRECLSLPVCCIMGFFFVRGVNLFHTR